MQKVDQACAEPSKAAEEQKVEQLFKDESIMAVYDMLDHFAEFVNIQLSYIRRNKDLPNDINEAVSSLIFASARCADLPELPAIRKLFGERYGQRFATASVELLPGNLVNREIKEKLSIKAVSDDVKYRLIDEIARDYCLQPETLALEYIPEMQQQEKEIGGHQEFDWKNSKTERSSLMQTSDAIEMEGKSLGIDPLAISTINLISQCHSYPYPDSDSICTSLSSSQQPSIERMETDSPVQKKAEKVGSMTQMDSPFQLTADASGGGQSLSISSICRTTLKHKDERIKAPSSSESLPQFSEEVVVYLDDIEELQSSMTKGGDYQDQRLFKFKSTVLPKRGALEDGNDGYDESYMDYEVQDEKPSSRNFSKRRNAVGKRSRRRSFSLESSSMKDTDHEIYYEKPGKSSPIHKHKSHHYRKLQKKTTVTESKESTCALKRMKQRCCVALGGNIQPNNFKYDTRKPCCNSCLNNEVNTCSLESPCYICICNQKRRIGYSGQFPILDAEENLDDKFCPFQYSSYEDEAGCIEMDETATLNQNVKRRSYENGGTVNKVFTLPKMQKEKSIGKVKGSDSSSSHVSSNSLLPSVASSNTRKETVAPYSRAMTMPQERPREIHKYSILRSNSLSFQNPNHVHPKLPEYDDIAAKFMALKKHHLLHKM
ncbi:hypothetical protein DITRI_Ditri08aG0062500 [Diplodiscus trichospermus]